MKTNRGDMPASSIDQKNGYSLGLSAPNGLTIRERFAMAAMQALLSNPSITRDERRNVSRLAVKHADDALAEMERAK